MLTFSPSISCLKITLELIVEGTYILYYVSLPNLIHATEMPVFNNSLSVLSVLPAWSGRNKYIMQHIMSFSVGIDSVVNRFLTP